MNIDKRKRQARLIDSICAIIILFPLIILIVMIDKIWIKCLFFVFLFAPLYWLYHIITMIILKDATIGMRIKKIHFVDENYLPPARSALVKMWLNFPLWSIAYAKSVFGRLGLQDWELKNFGCTVVQKE